MSKKIYMTLSCEPLRIESGEPILATSVVKNSMVSSVGQEIGTEKDFSATDYINTTWESGLE